MNQKILTMILVSVAIFLAAINPLQAGANSLVAGSSASLKTELRGPDKRIEKLEEFLASYNSPLTAYSQNFIEAADEYQIDWKLLPAITGVESTFGKQIPAYSYNAYGWSNGTYQFQSWEQSIDHVSRYLKEKYIDRGLNTPYKMGPVYAPPSKTWAGKVAYFMEQIECFGGLACFDNLELTI
jgi:hypothetical protein